MNKRIPNAFAAFTRSGAGIGPATGRKWTTIALGALMVLLAATWVPAEGRTVADGLYTVSGVAFEVDANGVFTGRYLRKSFPSLVYVSATPTQFSYRSPVGGPTFSLPCVGTTPRNGHVYRYPSGALALVTDTGEIFNCGQFPNGQTFAIPLLEGDVRTDLMQEFSQPQPFFAPGNSASTQTATSGANPWQACWDPTVSDAELAQTAMIWGVFNPCDVIAGCPPEMYRFEIMRQLFPFCSGSSSSSSTDWDAKLQDERDAIQEREMRRIERNSPNYVPKYGTGPTGTTITWDPKAAVDTGTPLVPWNSDFMPFF